MGRQRVFAANWKMNKTREDARAYFTRFRELYASRSNTTVIFFPPAPLLGEVHELTIGMPEVFIGGQNIHWEDHGAFTGEVSASMLLDFGSRFSLIGHSERYRFNGETTDAVARRTKRAIQHGIRPVLCVGESREMYDAGQSAQAVEKQLRESIALLDSIEGGSLIVAYEPVWAISAVSGGKAANPQECRIIREVIQSVLNSKFGAEFGSSISIIYGGSTNPQNIRSFLDEGGFDGVLPGQASLDPDLFAQMIAA